MLDPARIEEGMTVLDCRGKKVGWVLGVGHGHLHVGRGWLSVKDYFCQLERIAEVRGDHPCSPAGAPLARSSGAFPSRDSRSFRSPFRSALRHSPSLRLPVGGVPSLPSSARGYFGLC